MAEQQPLATLSTEKTHLSGDVNVMRSSSAVCCCAAAAGCRGGESSNSIRSLELRRWRRPALCPAAMVGPLAAAGGDDWSALLWHASLSGTGAAKCSRSSPSPLPRLRLGCSCACWNTSPEVSVEACMYH
jgi:hypothetical protein